MSASVTNWAGNVTFQAATVQQVTSVEQLQEVVAGSPQVRVLGTGHSFNLLADTAGTLLSVAALPRRLEVAPGRRHVTVSAGLRCGEVAESLHREGLALPNLASLPHISLAGAVATATHGSGDGNRSLASSVAAVQVVTADGALATVSRGDADFPGSVVSLGALGVMTALTLDVAPTYDMRQFVLVDLPFATFVENLDEVMSSAYSVSAFTDWRRPQRMRVWRKQLADQPPPPASWLGATLADAPQHPVPGLRADSATPQQGERGPWHERLPHFRSEFTPSSGAELQSELLLDRADAAAALDALGAIGHRLAPAVQTSEVRTVAADDLWLSPAYGRDTLAVHVTWQPDPAAVRPLVELMEERLAPFGPRPHWGKLSGIRPAEVVAAYPRAADFAALRRRVDPDRTFVNAYVGELFPD